MSLSQSKTIFVVFNNKFGGYGLSEEAEKLVGKYCLRHDPHLVEVVRKLGARANAPYADLCLEEIPVEYEHCYQIDEYDGLETVRCDPDKLVAHNLYHLNISALSDQECRETLIKYAALLNY